MKFGIACAVLVAKASSIFLLVEAAPRSNDKQRKDETDEGRHGNFVSREHSFEGKGTRIRKLLREQQAAGDQQSSSQTTTPNDESVKEERTSTTKRKSGRLMNLPTKSKEQTKRKLTPVVTCSAPQDNPCPKQQVPVCTKKAKSSTSTDYQYHFDCVDASKVSDVSVDKELDKDRFFASCGCCPVDEESSFKSTKVSKSLSNYDCTPVEDSNCFTGTNEDILAWCGNLPLDQTPCCLNPFVGEVTPNAGVCNFPGAKTTVCAGSCLGENACSKWGDHPDSTISIGTLSCIGTKSCYEVGTYYEAVAVVIEDKACVGEDSPCRGLGYLKGTDIVVSESACRESKSCYSAGYNKAAIIKIGPSSCVGSRSCMNMAFMALFPNPDVLPLQVGGGSCYCPDEGYCCMGAGASSNSLQIGDGICNGNNKPCSSCGSLFSNDMLLTSQNQCSGTTFTPL